MGLNFKISLLGGIRWDEMRYLVRFFLGNELKRAWALRYALLLITVWLIWARSLLYCLEGLSRVDLSLSCISSCSSRCLSITSKSWAVYTCEWWVYIDLVSCPVLELINVVILYSHNLHSNTFPPISLIHFRTPVSWMLGYRVLLLCFLSAHQITCLDTLPYGFRT